MTTRKKPGWTFWITVTVLWSLLYVGSYAMLIKPVPLPIWGGPGPFPKLAQYRYGGECAVLIFRPLEIIDRRVRSDLWLFNPNDPWK